MTPSDRAHAADFDALERDLILRDQRTPILCAVMPYLSEAYIRSCRRMGGGHQQTRDLLAISDAMLDEQEAGRDIPQDDAETLLLYLREVIV